MRRRRRHSIRLIHNRRIAGRTPNRNVTTRIESKTSSQTGVDDDPVLLPGAAATLITAHTTVSQAHQSLYTGAS